MDEEPKKILTLTAEELRILFLNVCVFRLGGEVSISAEDLQYIGHNGIYYQSGIVQDPKSNEVKFVLKSKILGVES